MNFEFCCSAAEEDEFVAFARENKRTIDVIRTGRQLTGIEELAGGNEDGCTFLGTSS